MNATSDRPNVLMFITHDQGDHLGCYGHRSIRSPNLDVLAGEGVRFTHFFASAPECTPSRAGLYTGVYTHQNGLMGLCHRGWEFDDPGVHLAARLWQAGYQTHLFGFQHETGGSPAELGYNRTYSQQDFSSAAVCAELVGFLGREAPRVSRPWFACAGFRDVHRPWDPKTSFSPQEVEVPPYLPDNSAVRADLAEFHQAVTDMDAAVGRALQALDRSGRAENTVVVFTTDHGIPFPRAKSTCYDPGIRCALIVRWPGHVKPGTVCDHLISNLDLCPTLLEICGADLPEGLEGGSFLGLLEGHEYKPREAVFGALYYDAAYDPTHYVRTQDHKYIRSFAVRPAEAAEADPEVLAKHDTGTWIRAGDTDVQRSPAWESIKPTGPFPPPPPEELYDLAADPLEQNNLIDDPAQAEVLGRMRAKLQEMMDRTHSPLLAGHVSPDLSRTRNVNTVQFKQALAARRTTGRP